MNAKKYESILKAMYMPYIKGEREITERVIKNFKNDLIKLEKL